MAIKGINKQIIEIKCTDNEYFDKVLLFVKSSSIGVKNNYLVNVGKEISRNLMDCAQQKYDFNDKKRAKKWNKGKIAAIISCIVAVFMIVLTVITIL